MSPTHESWRRSVTALERLFGVVGGFGLTESLKILLEPWLMNEPDKPLLSTFPWASSLLFVALLITIVPFFHGAVRQLDKVHFFPEGDPQPKRFIVDYSTLFLQMLIFVALGISVHSLRHFWWWAVVLMVVDAVWSLAVLEASRRTHEATRHIKVFLFLDMVALALLLSRCGLHKLVPWLQQEQGCSVGSTATIASGLFAVGAGLRTVLDYALNWDHYFDVPWLGSRKVYLAGPDVFLSNPLEAAEGKKALCRKYGFEGVFPLDAKLNLNGLSEREQALAISRANEKLVESCALVVAHVTPFRGPSADVGTAYEMGLARGLRRPVFAYTNVAEDFATRTKRFVGTVATRPDGLEEDPNGMLIESFGQADNLMVIGAIEESKGVLCHPAGAVAPGALFTDLQSFEQCLVAARKAFERVGHG